jgi:hypothetical protein
MITTTSLLSKLVTASEPLLAGIIQLALDARSLPPVSSPVSPPVSSPISPHEATVSLWASEVGSYLGKDSWTSRDKALGNVWRRTNEAHFRCIQTGWRTAGCRFGVFNSADTADKLRTVFDPYPEVRTAEDVAAFRARASADEVLRLYKTKGCLFEDNVAQLFGDSIHQPVALRHAAVAWRSDVGAAVAVGAYAHRAPGPITDPGLFTIVGEVDGWLLQPPYANTVVEFKVRMQNVPPLAPDRDLLQVQTYLNINGVDNCMYVQNLFGTKELYVQSMKRDKRMWEEEVMPALRKFVCDVRRLLRSDAADKQLQHQVLMACESDGHPKMRAPSVPVPVHPPAVAPKKSTVVVDAPPAKLAALPAVMPAAPPASPIAKSKCAKQLGRKSTGKQDPAPMKPLSEVITRKTRRCNTVLEQPPTRYLTRAKRLKENT